MTSTLLLQNFTALRRKINRLAVQEAKKIGLGAKQLSILRALYREGTASVTLLAEQTDSDLATASRSLGALERKGWLRREKDPQDSRRQVVSLTAKGKRKSDELNAVIERLADLLFGNLSRNEKTEFMKILDKLHHTLDQAELNRG